MKRINVAVAAVVLAATTSIAGATTPAEAPDALVADAMERAGARFVFGYGGSREDRRARS